MPSSSIVRRFVWPWVMTWALLTSGIVFLIVWGGGIFVDAVPVVGIAVWAAGFAALLVGAELQHKAARLRA